MLNKGQSIEVSDTTKDDKQIKKLSAKKLLSFISKCYKIKNFKLKCLN